MCKAPKLILWQLLTVIWNCRNVDPVCDSDGHPSSTNSSHQRYQQLPTVALGWRHRKARYWLKIAIFLYSTWFDAAVKEDCVRNSLQYLVRKKLLEWWATSRWKFFLMIYLAVSTHLTLKYIVILKSRLGVTQDYGNGTILIDRIRVPTGVPR